MSFSKLLLFMLCQKSRLFLKFIQWWNVAVLNMVNISGLTNFVSLNELILLLAYLREVGWAFRNTQRRPMDGRCHRIGSNWRQLNLWRCIYRQVLGLYVVIESTCLGRLLGTAYITSLDFFGLPNPDLFLSIPLNIPNRLLRHPRTRLHRSQQSRLRLIIKPNIAAGAPWLAQ